ncbi:hypothetical protein CASFOL_020015 [Castilleja foliolosa]|uniref:Uncharacterized protein n=1 Tax=Castilleja foliolosa TaxID=1961234 RepID=A0ABD3CZM4_9LAMI
MPTAHFVISDDLQIFPSDTANVIRFLSNMFITDTDEIELMDVTFGYKEIMDLLKGALLSDTPLTDIVLDTMNVECNAVKLEIGTSLVWLTIPLGGIENLLCGSTKFKNIDNLYRTKDTKNILLNPKLPPGYTSHSQFRQFLPLTEEIPPPLYLHQDSWHDYLSPFINGSKYNVSVRYTSPKGQGVPLLDVREQELNIGLDEALKILRASLTSTRGLSDGLRDLLLEKQPKQEQRA